MGRTDRRSCPARGTTRRARVTAAGTAPGASEAERCVLTADHDRVRVLTLNRPGTRNAIDLELRVMLAGAMGIAAFGERHQPAFRGR